MSLTKKETKGYIYKTVTFETWDHWLLAREFAGQCRNEHKLKQMTDSEEMRRAFMYALVAEAKDGWKLVIADWKLGIVFCKEGDMEEITLEELFEAKQ